MGNSSPKKHETKIHSHTRRTNETVLKKAFRVSLSAFCCLLVSTLASLAWLTILIVRHDRTIEFNFMAVITALQLLNILLHSLLFNQKSRKLFYILWVTTGGTICYLVIFTIIQSVNKVRENPFIRLFFIADCIGFVHCILIAADIYCFRMINKNKGQWSEVEINSSPFAVSSFGSSNFICDSKNVAPASLTITDAEEDELTSRTVVVVRRKCLTKSSKSIPRRELKLFPTIIKDNKKKTIEIVSKNNRNTIISETDDKAEYPTGLNPFEENGYPETNNPFSNLYSESSLDLYSTTNPSNVFLLDAVSGLPDSSPKSSTGLHTTTELSDPQIREPKATSTPKDGFRKTQRRMEYTNSVLNWSSSCVSNGTSVVPTRQNQSQHSSGTMNDRHPIPAILLEESTLSIPKH